MIESPLSSASLVSSDSLWYRYARTAHFPAPSSLLDYQCLQSSAVSEYVEVIYAPSGEGSGGNEVRVNFQPPTLVKKEFNFQQHSNTAPTKDVDHKTVFFVIAFAFICLAISRLF